MTFTEARHTARMTRQQVADYLGLSKTTIQKYEKTGKAPKAVIECLMMIGGMCPTFSRRNDFSGWSFGGGFLYSPEGDKFTSGDVRAGKLALLEQERQHRLYVKSRKSVEHGGAEIVPFPVSNQQNHRKHSI